MEGRKPPSMEDSTLPGCSEESICYSLQCLECWNKGIERRYEGEMSRSPYERGLEHTTAVDTGETDHPLVRHAWEEHQGRKPQFLMKIKSRHKTPLDRLTQEAVNILALSRKPDGVDLNSKSEWGQARIPRIQMHMPGQDRPGSNPNQNSNPEFKVYLAAVVGAARAGTK